MVKARSTTKETNPPSTSKLTELRTITAHDQTAMRELRLYQDNSQPHRHRAVAGQHRATPHRMMSPESR
uniref:Uncharacterized protein n=1 Tax=Leersia perrieri TaxID=77586 RepID=A0A0D9XZ73_9ORYZ